MADRSPGIVSRSRQDTYTILWPLSMKSPIKWFGGKGGQPLHLLPLIPPHKVYVEALAGGASLFFAKAPAGIEVITDLVYDIFNLISTPRPRSSGNDGPPCGA